jgi:hypothetical protein
LPIALVPIEMDAMEWREIPNIGWRCTKIILIEFDRVIISLIIISPIGCTIARIMMERLFQNLAAQLFPIGMGIE